MGKMELGLPIPCDMFALWSRKSISEAGSHDPTRLQLSRCPINQSLQYKYDQTLELVLNHIAMYVIWCI